MWPAAKRGRLSGVPSMLSWRLSPPHRPARGRQRLASAGDAVVNQRPNESRQTQHGGADSDAEQALQPRGDIGDWSWSLNKGDEKPERELRSEIVDLPPRLNVVADPDTGSEGEDGYQQARAEQANRDKCDRAAKQASERPVGYPLVDGSVSAFSDRRRRDDHDDVRSDRSL